MTIDENLLKTRKHIHFIGIGGSGMFPMVQILHSEGFYITGSDNNETETTKIERKMGIPVTFGQAAENIEGADLIVYTAAIMADNPELIAAKASGVPCLERSDMLGLLTRRYSKAVCVAGTHGKTTTSAMIAQTLLEGGFDPSAFIGGKVKALGGSGRAGKSDIFVVEACEFVDTFLKLSNDISVILNIDNDHLDYFGTIENSIKSFRKFASNSTGPVIVNGDDANTMKAVEGLDKEIITFGWSSKNDYYAENVRFLGGAKSGYTLMHHGEAICEIRLSIPGKHNILNSMACAAVCLYLGMNHEEMAEHIDKFPGAGRRFEILGEVNGVTIADDYAHHPTEIAATLKAAKEMDFHEVWAVFQPFTYSRTALLMDDFVTALSVADHVVMSEIMGSREKNTYNVYTKDLAEKIPGSVWFNTFQEMADYTMSHAAPGDLVITLGCGDVYKCAYIMAGID